MAVFSRAERASAARNRVPVVWQPLSPKREAELPQTAAGRYEVLVGG